MKEFNLSDKMGIVQKNRQSKRTEDILLKRGEEFNLSDKICEGFGDNFIHCLDIKEFIKRLEEEFEEGTMYSADYIKNKIFKLAGDLK